MSRLDIDLDFLDTLSTTGAPPSERGMVEIDGEIIIPKRCSICKSAPICSALPTFISFSKIGIFTGVEQCPFFNPAQQKKKQ